MRWFLDDCVIASMPPALSLEQELFVARSTGDRANCKWQDTCVGNAAAFLLDFGVRIL